MEDVFRGFALGGEVLDESVNGGDRGDGGSGGRGGSSGFSVSNLLGAVVPFEFSGHLGGPAFICAVSFLAASETESFPNALGMVSRRELFQVDGVDIMASESLVERELEENKERGRPCPFLRAMI